MRRFQTFPPSSLDHRAGQVAGRSQLRTCLGCSSKQDQRIGRDRRSGDFRIAEVGFEADRVVISRGFVTKSIQAVEFEHRPGRFDAIPPTTNLGILEESWCGHMRSDTGLLGFYPLPDRRSTTPIPQPPAISDRHHDQDLVGSRGIGY